MNIHIQLRLAKCQTEPLIRTQNKAFCDSKVTPYCAYKYFGRVQLEHKITKTYIFKKSKEAREIPPMGSNEILFTEICSSFLLQIQNQSRREISSA